MRRAGEAAKAVGVDGWRGFIVAGALLAATGWGVGQSQAHDRAAHGEKPVVGAAPPLPAHINTPGFPDLKGGDFELIDGDGRSRTAKDPMGRPQLLFFGYATCQAICSVALPRIAETIERLDGLGIIATPVMITVDPARDTVAAIGAPLAKLHPRFVGLTGSEANLEAAYRVFQIERKVVFTHPDYGDVLAHGSFIYLLDGAGQFLTLLPPVLSPERMAEVIQGYLQQPVR